MKKLIKKISVLTVMTLFFGLPAFSQEDAEGCKDHPLFTKMNDTYINACSDNYSELELRTGKEKTTKKEGNLYVISYYFNFDNGQKPKNPFQIIKNYENAVLSNGGKLIYKNTDALDADLEATFHLYQGGKEYWVRLFDFGGTPAATEHYSLYILEMESMIQEISAEKMKESLNTLGSIALYINFDSGKAEIKEDSKNIIEDLYTLLKENSGLKISIEGHTDNEGDAIQNLTLSKNRANAVMNALISKGIDKTRLTAKGLGQTKPIADNTTEEGKAKNRRVEIVKI